MNGKEGLNNAGHHGHSKEVVPLTLAIVFGAGVAGSLSITDQIEQLRLANIKNPFELVRMDGNNVILKQDGKEFTFNNVNIPPELRAKLEESYPKFASFLKSGPIKILERKDTKVEKEDKAK